MYGNGRSVPSLVIPNRWHVVVLASESVGDFDRSLNGRVPALGVLPALDLVRDGGNQTILATCRARIVGPASLVSMFAYVAQSPPPCAASGCRARNARMSRMSRDIR